MFNKLKSSRDLRLAATIAAGVFGGLFAYRLFMWSHEWWENLSTDNQQEMLATALGAAMAGIVFYALRRVRARIVRVKRARAESIESLRKKSTVDLLRMSFARFQETGTVPDSLRQLIRERSNHRNLPEFVDAIAEVHAEFADDVRTHALECIWEKTAAQSI